MTYNPIPYGRQQITDDDLDAVKSVLLSDYLTQGPAVQEFESKFAAYVGAKYAVAVSNGTAALHLAAMALGVKKGSRVITSPITFVASANCVRYCEGEVYFADIDPNTYLLDINAVKALIDKHPKGYFSGIIPVDFSGHAVNLELFRNLADEHGLWIIEDACHSPGGYFADTAGKHQSCGNGKFAEISIFSFHPVKHIACGEGGMLTTNDEKLHGEISRLRTHGITKDTNLMERNDGGWYYEMQELGYNYRLTDFQAALGTSQLQRADKGLARRRNIAEKYAKELKGVNHITGQSGLVDGHAYHLYVIETPRRKELYDHLRERNVFCQVHYIPAHLMPYYKNLGWKTGDLPIAENYYSKCLSLPMFPSLTEAEQNYVIDSIKNFK